MIDDSADNVWVEKPNGEHFPINGACSIGRSAINELVVADEKVSRRHALIHLQGAKEYWLVDLGSSNGTYVNGRRAAQPLQLHDGARIQIGSFEWTFRQPSAVRRDERELEESVTRTVQDIKSAPCWLLVADIVSSTQLIKQASTDELAMVTGRWLAECKQTIEECGGSINKFLGDGFFAYWHEHGKTTLSVVRALLALKRLQSKEQLHFRIVLHYGLVCSGGGGSLGEESLSGKEVNFVFRMEKLAAALGEACLVSQPSQERLLAAMETAAVGQHSLPGYDGKFSFFRI
jgi:adenylate cyclase